MPASELPRPNGAAAVLEQELRDLWLGGRALLLSLAFSLLVSVVAYLVATNRALNFLEQRETVNLVLQVAIAVGGLLALLAGADAISGERERSTLESLLLTPVTRTAIAGGKLLASLSLWIAAFAIAVPYVWFLGRGVGIAGDALAAGIVVGTLLAVFLASLGILFSVFSTSNRISLSLSLFGLLALFTPTQLPSGARRGWVGDLLLRIDPITAGEHYVGKIVVNAHAWSGDATWLLPRRSPRSCSRRSRSRPVRASSASAGACPREAPALVAALVAVAVLGSRPAAALAVGARASPSTAPRSVRPSGTRSCSGRRSRTAAPLRPATSSPISTSSACVATSTSIPRTGRPIAPATWRRSRPAARRR